MNTLTGHELELRFDEYQKREEQKRRKQLIGSVFGLKRYRIKRYLNEGGMSTVFVALDRLQSKDIALKLLKWKHRNNPSLIARFIREALITARVQRNGKNIVSAFDYNEYNGWYYLAMPLMKETLQDKRMSGALTLDKIVEFFYQLTLIVQTLHQEGIIHRDIKPENIFFDDRDVLYLGDFGVAHDPLESITMLGEAIGTPMYMPPRQWEGVPAEVSFDIFAMGVVLKTLLTDLLLPHQVNNPNRPSIPLPVASMDTNVDTVIFPATHPSICYSMLSEIAERAMSDNDNYRIRSVAEIVQHLELMKNRCLS